MLTEKELLILTLRSRGLRQTEIADLLKTTQGTVSRTETTARRKIQEALTHLETLEKLKVNHGEKARGAQEVADEISALTKRWRT